jgi:hypothetical protein
LEETSTFFSLDSQPHEHDSGRVNQIRSSALTLAGMVVHPHFDRFLVYLLGSTASDADYPLQAIRMLCLVAYVSRNEHLAPEQREELLTAAFLADTGFRPAWLGHHGTHSEVAIYHLRTPGIPWITPTLERLISNHHQPLTDPSPNRILSLVARYLGLVYGTGQDDVGHAGVLPARAIETLIEETERGAPGLNLFMKTLSAFPLGSWVQLNAGVAALVIGGNPSNPLRPRVGLYRAEPSGIGRWLEHDLGKEMTLYISREIVPTPAQLSLVNIPEIFLPGWMGASSEASRDIRLPPPEIVSAVGAEGNAGQTLPSSIKTIDDYRSHILGHGKPAPTGPAPAGAPLAATGSHPAADLTLSSTLSKQDVLKFYRDELAKLRAEWEQKLSAAEQVSSSLKAPLIDSYRRENQLMATILDRIDWMDATAAKTPEPPSASLVLEEDAHGSVVDLGFETPAAPAPVPPRQPEPEPILPPVKEIAIDDELPTGLEELPEETTSGLTRVETYFNELQRLAGRDRAVLAQLRESLLSIRQALENASKDPATGSLLSLITHWLQKLDETDASLAQTADRISILAEGWQGLAQKLRALLEESGEDVHRSWKEPIRPKMENTLKNLWKELSVRHRHVAAHAKLINQFTAEARQIRVSKTAG